MKIFIILWAAILCNFAVHSQSFKKYPIGNSGCSAYFFCDPVKFELAKSPDSSEVYTGECGNDDVAYGTICVKLKDKLDTATYESVLIAYLDYLKNSLEITGAVGYGKGHRLRNREDTRGVIDYWTDKQKNNWKIKGWTDSKYLVVMYAYSKKELNETKVNVFLDGLVLPGM